MKKILFLSLAITTIISCLIGCTNSSHSSYDNGYSDTYNNDSNYRQTVDDISNMTGDSHREVDRKIDAMTRAINGE